MYRSPRSLSGYLRILENMPALKQITIHHCMDKACLVSGVEAVQLFVNLRTGTKKLSSKCGENLTLSIKNDLCPWPKDLERSNIEYLEQRIMDAEGKVQAYPDAELGDCTWSVTRKTLTWYWQSEAGSTSLSPTRRAQGSAHWRTVIDDDEENNQDFDGISQRTVQN